MSSPTERAVARLQLYCLIAKGFSHPEPDSLAYGFNDDYRNQVAEAGKMLFGEEIVMSPVTETFVRLETQYIDLFLSGNNGRPAVCLHAGDYDELLDGQPRPELLLHYSNWYKHFGVKVRQDEQANELPDHLVCQFEFLAWLADLQAGAINKPELESGYVLAQRDFIQRRMQPFFEYFLPVLVKETEQRGTVAFFRELGELADMTLERTVHEFNSILGPSSQDQDLAVHAKTPGSNEPVDLWS